MFVFIISWSGQHENAQAIARSLLKTGYKIAIVYSDPNPTFAPDVPCALIRRPNELFWEDKFKACLDHAGNKGMLVIHADCSCKDWASLVQRCAEVVQSHREIGVWAPRIDGPYWNLSTSGLFKLKNHDLVVSAMIDAIVFYLSPQVIDRMRQVSYGNNKFGWGIGGLFCATSYVHKQFVVIDANLEVIHPLGRRGYDEDEAKRLMRGFLQQFTPMERLQHQLLVTQVQFKHLKLLHQQGGAAGNV